MEPSANAILFVEDDQDLRDSVLEALRDEGYGALGFPEGAAALSFLHEAEPKPQLILRDYMMPGMNGSQFRAQQLQAPELAAIPVVLLSAHAEIEATARALGVTDFLKKPVKLISLLELVHRFMA